MLILGDYLVGKVLIYISYYDFMEDNKHVTIYDIAERLNLATSTISRA